LRSCSGLQFDGDLLVGNGKSFGRREFGYFELQKSHMNEAKVARWMRRYVHTVASQGLRQVGIIRDRTILTLKSLLCSVCCRLAAAPGGAGLHST
jgi:hypothetical protein